MKLSPQSEAIISSLLSGQTIQSGDVTVGPLDSATRVVLKVITNDFDVLSSLAGQERARTFLQSYQQATENSADNAGSADRQASTKGLAPVPAHLQAAAGWRLLEVFATSYRGLAPIGTEVDFAFDGNSTLIFGPNGSGKSSLLGSVMWCLTGQAVTDAEEQEDSADYFAPSQGMNRGKRLGKWPIHVTLPKEAIKKASPTSHVTLRLRSEDGKKEMWLRRADSEGLSQSTDGNQWSDCTSLREIGVSPLDLQLSLTAPIIFGRRTIERAEESRDILRLMLGFEDLVALGNLAGDIARNRTAYENAEISVLEQAIERNSASLRELTAEIDEKHQLRKPIADLAGKAATLTEKDIQNVEMLLSELVSAQEVAIAKAIGLTEATGLKPDGLADKLIRAVAILEGGVSQCFANFAAISVTTALPTVRKESAQEHIAELKAQLFLFFEKARDNISARYDWWQREMAPESRANLLLTAALYYNPHDEKCPVCERSISDLPIKATLSELKGFPKELLKEVRDFFRDLSEGLNALVPQSLQSISKLSTGQRLEADWKKLKSNLNPVFSALAGMYDKPLQDIARACLLGAAEPPAILPAGCDAAFEELASEFRHQTLYAITALDTLQWSTEHFADVDRQLTDLLLRITPAEKESFLQVLAHGRVAADDVAALARVKSGLKAIYQNQQGVTQKRAMLTELAGLREPLSTVKLVAAYAEREVGQVFSGIAEQTVRYWSTLYPEVPSDLTPDSVIRGQKTIESLLAGSDFAVQAKFFANSGLQRAIALAFYFALLEKHPRGLGFIVMDDAILSLDAEHREIWSADLLRPLMHSMQVVFATHQREFLQNARQDFLGEKVVQLNPRIKGRPISWRPGGRLDNATEELREGSANVATTLRKYVEELLMSFDAYGENSFYKQRDLTGSVKRYAELKAPNPLAGENQAAIAEILRNAEVGRVIDAGSHAATEAGVTNPMVRRCLELLRKCEKRAGAEFERLETLRRPERKARHLRLVKTDFPAVPRTATWKTPIAMRALGRAAAKQDDVTIMDAELASGIALAPGCLVLVSTEALEPIARRGQWAILAEETESISEGDLVAAEGPNGGRYLRRAWSDGEFWRLQSINPVRPLAIESVPKVAAAIRRLRGVLFDPASVAVSGDEKQEWEPSEYPFYDDLPALSCVYVEGNSLDPIARKGQMVLVGEGVPMKDAILERGSLCVLETQNENIGNVIKRVFAGDGTLVLVSVNPVHSHEPIVVKTGEVTRIWPLRGVLFDAQGL